MTFGTRGLAGVALGLTVVLAAGCTTTPSGARLGYASWNHLMFSVRSNWQEFVGWAPVGTPEDERLAERDGGWWGGEVRVLPER